MSGHKVPLPAYVAAVNQLRKPEPPISYAALYHCVLRGEVEAERVGRAWMLDPSTIPAVAAWLKSGRRPSPPPKRLRRPQPAPAA